MRSSLLVLIACLIACGQPEAARPQEVVPTEFGARLERVRAFCDAPDDVIIEPIGSVVLRDDHGRWSTAFFDNLRHIDVQAEAVTLKRSTRYFVYARLVAGLSLYEVSLDPPDSNLVFRLGDERYAFVTTFHTDFAGPHVLRFAQTNREYRYTMLADGSDLEPMADNLVLTDGHARKQETVYLNDTAWLGIARQVFLKARLTGGSSGGQLRVGQQNFGNPSMSLSVSAYGTAVDESTLLYPNTGAFDYQLDANANSADAWVAGFTF